MEQLVSTDWLEAELGAPDLKVVDASWFMPDSGRDARAEFEAAHIPGAVFLDLDEVSDADHPAPHMLPAPKAFARHMEALGLGSGDRILVYDNSPYHTAARAWWMLRAMGAGQVALLDGGLHKWQAEGRPLAPASFVPSEVEGRTSDRSPAKARAQNGVGNWVPASAGAQVIAKDELLGLLTQSTHSIADARSAGRFTGAEPEPRPGLASGHIPGSRNLPQGRLFNPDDTWKRGAALQAEFDAAGVDLSKPLVTTCGSGITACVLLFGAALLGHSGGRLYDGSWTEWGADPGTPKEVGPA